MARRFPSPLRVYQVTVGPFKTEYRRQAGAYGFFLPKQGAIAVGALAVSLSPNEEEQDFFRVSEGFFLKSDAMFNVIGFRNLTGVALAFDYAVAFDPSVSIEGDSAASSVAIVGPVTVTGTVTADTELPPAALLTDDFANPTAPAVGAFGMVFDGAAWDRMRGDSVFGVDVDVTRLPAITGTVFADTELPPAALLTDSMANPTAPAVAAHGMVWDSALNIWNRMAGTQDGVTVRFPGFELTELPFFSVRIASGPFNSNGDVLEMFCAGMANIAFEVPAGLTATVQIEATFDGVNWFNINAQDLNGGIGNVLLLTGAVFRGFFVTTAYLKVRLRVSAYTSGSVTVTFVGQPMTSLVRVSEVFPSVSSTALGKAEDFPHASGDVGVEMLGVRRNTKTPLAGTEGDYMPPILDEEGGIWLGSLVARDRADTFTAAAQVGTTIDGSARPGKLYSLQVTPTGAVTSWNVVLEGSLDNVAFTTILTHTNAAPGAGLITPSGAAYFPAKFYRTRCVAIVLGAGTNVVARLLSIQ